MHLRVCSDMKFKETLTRCAYTYISRVFLIVSIINSFTSFTWFVAALSCLLKRPYTKDYSISGSILGLHYGNLEKPDALVP